MRIGVNPEKQKTKLEIDSYHRVIIPVYIPNLQEDYFKDGLDILKLCLDSLLSTIHKKTKISLINNGCCEEVDNYLSDLHNRHSQVDQLISSKINLGKVNAIYSIVKSNLEPILTIADADVMFLPRWQDEVENIISVYPEAGMVSPVPSSIAYQGYFLNSTVFYAFFKSKLSFSSVIDPEGMINFEKSIGRKMYKKIHLKKYLTISKKNTKAVIGCGHFVATFRAEVFKKSPTNVCQHKIVGGSETLYLDEPNDKSGFLRLSTTGNYAYHLGNKIEDWMIEKLEWVKEKEKKQLVLKEIPNPKSIKNWQIFIGKVFHRLFLVKFKKQYFSLKGVKENY